MAKRGNTDGRRGGSRQDASTDGTVGIGVRVTTSAAPPVEALPADNTGSAHPDRHSAIDRYPLDDEARVHFRDELRRARDTALMDAEGFAQVPFALERLGSFMLKGVHDLGKYAGPIGSIAGRSPLAKRVPKRWPQFHLRFDTLYEIVREGRNGALHQGVYARHLTTHAVELALVVEDGLMDGRRNIGHFMVRQPVCAEPWHPVSFVRQVMLLNSFSYLPLRWPIGKGGDWMLLSDVAVARYLRVGGAVGIDDRLVLDLNAAIERGGLTLDRPAIYSSDRPVTDFLSDKNGGSPALVVEDGQLVGIISPFDVL